MFHVDNNFRTSLLLCAFNKKTADLSEIRQPYFYFPKKIALEVVWYIG